MHKNIWGPTIIFTIIFTTIFTISLACIDNADISHFLSLKQLCMVIICSLMAHLDFVTINFREFKRILKFATINFRESEKHLRPSGPCTELPGPGENGYKLVFKAYLTRPWANFTVPYGSLIIWARGILTPLSLPSARHWQPIIFLNLRECSTI